MDEIDGWMCGWVGGWVGWLETFLGRGGGLRLYRGGGGGLYDVPSMTPTMVARVAKMPTAPATRSRMSRRCLSAKYPQRGATKQEARPKTPVGGFLG